MLFLIGFQGGTITDAAVGEEGMEFEAEQGKKELQVESQLGIQ